MADPGYDFFATGAPAGTAEPASEPAPAPEVSRFGGPVVAPEAPAAPAYAAPAPAAPAPVAVPGYNPGNVNQFGTPADLAAVPTGPYAAPGLGAAPIEQPGLVSTWAGPAAPAPAAASAAAPTPAPPAPAPAGYAPPAPTAYAPPPTHLPPPTQPVPTAPVAVSRFGSPIPPDVLVEDPSYAALAFGTPAAGVHGYGAPAGHAQQPAAAAKPGAVTAAGVIGIVEGALLLAIGLLGLLGYLALKSQLDQLAASPELAGSGLSMSTMTNLVLVGVVIVMLMGTGYVAAGVATVRGARWGAWALLVVSALNVLYSLYQLVSGDAGFGTLLSIGVSGAVVVLLCLADSMRWLRQS